jgi:hypothetical protein
VLTVIGVLLFPEFSPGNIPRWRTTYVAVAMVVFLWLGGSFTERLVEIEPLPFTAMMVQPSRSIELSSISALRQLTKMTSFAMVQLT